MTLQALLTSGPFLLDLVIVGTYIIGASATTFGLYDIYKKKWAGDLKVMTTTLLLCATILPICETIKQGTVVSNAMLFTYIFIAFATYFMYNFYENKNLTHEKRKQTNYIKKLLTGHE